MIKRELVQKILLGMVLCLTVFPVSISARSSSEIADDIRRQQEELARTQQNLNQARNNINLYSNAITGTAGSLPDLENQIKQLEAEIEANNYELDLNRQMKLLKELEKESREIKQNSTLKSIYMDWRIESATSVKEVLHSFDFKKYEQYTSFLTNTQQENIFLISSELNDLNNEIKDYEIKLEELNKKNEELATKKKQLEEQILFYNSMLAYNSAQARSLTGNISTIQGNITGLTEQQRQAILREEEILRQNQGTLGNTDCLKDPNAPAGSIYFCGNGRDLYQGHGVGMSQYGAWGAAMQGYNADSIVQFYYPGAQVVQYALNSEISVKYCQGNPARAAFQENCYADLVPPWNQPEYYGPVVTSRISFDSYLAGLGEMPRGWHVEARKAQMIAARTYAARYTGNGNPNIPICLTVYCQVSYVMTGDQGESAIVQQTKDKVLTYGGVLIEALYSSDNNQGNGSADIDTRFQQTNGNPNPGNSVNDKPYLRSVNDNQFAQSARNQACGGPCGLWKWKTYSYTMSDIDQYLRFAGYGGWVDSSTGVASISFERDPSLRVKRVIFFGKNGQNLIIGGWWFKNYWISWAASKGTNDFIYSQTYFLNSN